ncbi:DNA ligase 6 isoform X1 [Arachis stenosperma]|uniref:DNA ligase 6 isoform X1 n=1 Tax=Arachis stenosperma TaxID=217475 RepID=UPI0025ACB80E|nr:DNA ligase 6 isoform X1 [Arachis stenosperma]
MDPQLKPQTLNSTSLFLAATTATTHSEQPPHSLSLTTVPSTVPRSKLIPNTRFLVDAFRHADTAFSVSYFLSHFHSDHYTGLSSSWSRGIVFCSATTASLLQRILGVHERFLVPLPLCQPVEIDGAEVTLVDANHCPGAVQFLFKVPTKEEGKKFERYVHTGDFRFCSSMILEPAIVDFVGCDAVFLDTTYCNPKFVFPSQEESVDYVVSVVKRVISDCGDGSGVLFLVATYVIGKEKILVELARRVKRKVHVDARKMEVLRVLGYGESGVFTEDSSESNIHVVGWNVLGETWPYFKPNFVRMKEIMIERGYSKVVGFVPTGWTYEVKRNRFPVRSKDSFEIHLVLYSEHSNYEELREYVKFLKPRRVVPTVGLDVEKSDSKHADKMRKYFALLVDETANKQEFLKGFHRATGDTDFLVEKDVNDGQKPGKNMEEGIKPSELDGEESTIPDVAASVPSSTGEPCTKGVTLLTDEEKKKMIEELGNCLPTWVTRSQMLELISISGSNVVEAASNFYERETEFHKQAFSCQTSSLVSKCSSLNDIDSPSKACLNPSSTTKNIDVFPSQDSTKLTILKHTVLSQASSAKRNKSSGSKPNKKVKVKAKSQSQSSDPKQSTITKFFSKVLPVKPSVAQSDRSELMISVSPKAKNMLPDDVGNQYKDEIDQFMQIINGKESLKDHAITIIEKAKGDVNKALDIYYCNSGNLGEKEISVQAECKIDSSLEKNCVLHELKGIPDTTMKRNHVTLPLEKYNPKEHACWKDGQPAPYLHLARTFSLLEDEKGKIKASSMICNTFRSLLALSPADVLPAVYLCTNKIAADHEKMELNIGGSIVTAALEEACGTNRSKIREMYNKFGDLGDVAQECRQTQRLLAPPTPLLIKDVFSALQKISLQTGHGSTSRKKGIIISLMRSCREKEIKFLVRTLVRNLRIGAMLRTVLPALAQAVVMNSFPTVQQEGTSENLKEKLQVLSVEIVEAYNIIPNLDLIVPSLMNKGIDFSVSSLSMVPGIPIKPMLATITNGIPKALNLFQNKAFTCEYKYDGQRAQIHRLIDGSIRVFSRNGDESTSRFPDLIDIIKEFCKPVASTFIIDAEVVGIDRKNGIRIMSFQELSSRGKGSKDTLVTTESIKVDICIFVFDIMFANGEQLLGFPLRTRRKYLKDLLCDEKPGYFEYAKEITIEADKACETCKTTLTKINAFLEDALRSSCEGIMVKTLDVDAGYSPSKRSDKWLKVKRDYVEGLNDSLDLVPIGAWHGNGRKAGWYSPFLMACYNPETEEYQSVCRVMSGFSDSFYKEMKEFFSEDNVLSKKPLYYRTAEEPDMWFCPQLVWEIRGADFTVSPVHHAAIGLIHPTRGISIRFPRFISRVLDRNPEECTTAADIVDLFNSQTRKMDVTAED